jgi:hypothetical protein
MDEKLETQAAPLAAIDEATLTPPVQSALGSKTLEVVNWECRQLHGGLAAGTSVYRFSGQGCDGGQTIPWSLILKILRPEGGSTDVAAWNYFRREADAYQSGWLDDLQGGLVAPRCFGVLNHPDGTCWIWLEEVAEEIGSQWPVEYYGVVARHLGRFNGAYLVDRPLPAWHWLSSDWLRNYTEQSAPAMAPLRNALGLPWARRWLLEEDRDEYFRFWAERELYYDALDRLPQTICHLDIFRRNLFARKTADGEDQTVAIDWAFVGKGPLGAELNPLVWVSVGGDKMGGDKAREFEETTLEGYLTGLRDAGWRGDPRQVRLGYTATCIRYLFVEVGRWLTLILDESQHASLEQMFGAPLGEILDSFGRSRRPMFRRLDEARELMDILG